MAIYYVDTFLGSDANTGLTWAQAWKTLYPLTALYSGQSSILDLEVRIAKTTPYETARTIAFSPPFSTTHAFCSGEARTLAGYRKAVIPDNGGVRALPFDWGATTISPFYGDSEGGSPYRPAGTYKFRVAAPAGANGRALRWPVTGGSLSSFQCMEIVGVVHGDGVTVSIELCTDTGGGTVLRTYTLPLGEGATQARLCLVGEGDLPNGVGAVFVHINNTSGQVRRVELSSLNAVLAHNHANYVGLRQIYVPNDKLGTTLSPVSSSGAFTVFNGHDGSGVDTYRTSQSLAARTWSVHPWTPYPYPISAIFAQAFTIGTASVPLKIYGGWNRATDTMDGVTALDSGNLKMFRYASRISLDIRNIAVAFRRAANSANVVGFCGIMEEFKTAFQRLVNCRAEKVYIPAGGAGVVGETIGFYLGSYPLESLLAVSDLDSDRDLSSAAIQNCNTVVAPPFTGAYRLTQALGSTFGMSQPNAAEGTTYTNCVFINNRTAMASGAGGGFYPPIVMQGCDIVTTFVSNAWGNDFACSPRGAMNGCTFWGAYTGPRSLDYKATACEFRPLPLVLGPVCGQGIDIDGFTCLATDASVTTPTAMFARGGASADPVTLRIRNANLRVPFASLTALSSLYDQKGHTVLLDNVTLHKTVASAGAAFLSTRLTASDVTLVGAWDSLLSGVIRGAEVNGVVVTDATTKLVNNFSFSGPATGWGRVSSYFRNILHPLGLAGFVGTPVVRYASGAAWFHTLTGELWASEVFSVTRDTSIAHSGLSSWKCTTLTHVGAVSRASFMLGVLPVVAGVASTFSAYVRRGSYDVLAGLFVRPMGTREFAAPGSPPVATLFDIVAMQDHNQAPEQWVKLTITYTPFATGLIELHFGMRGIAGSTVWLDTLKATQ